MTVEEELKHAIRLIQLQSRLIKKVSHPSPVPDTGKRLVRMPEVVRRTGLSKRTIYRLEAAGKFPRRRRLGLRAVGWPEHQLAAWIVDPTSWRPTENVKNPQSTR